MERKMQSRTRSQPQNQKQKGKRGKDKENKKESKILTWVEALKLKPHQRSKRKRITHPYLGKEVASSTKDIQPS